MIVGNRPHSSFQSNKIFMTRLAFALFALGLSFSNAAQAQYFTDTGSPANPAWSTILPTLNNDAPDPGPVYGSDINVNNALTEVGLYGNRAISAGPLRIHIPCNTSTTNFANFTRWYQTDGNTQVFRLFVNDENTASTRVGAARSEAFTETKWATADNVTYEWTGRYTIAARQQGAAIFQVMNSDNEWAMQLSMGSNGTIGINNRRNAGDVTVMNPDGSAKDFDGLGFDMRVHDDGHNYKVWIDGVLLADNFYDRPTGDTNFRWGMYLGSNVLTAPSTQSIILVSGAQTKSWSGDLDTPITFVTKANNNAANLSAGGSWTGGVAPGLYEIAQWNNSVNTTNCNSTLNADQVWSGIKITSPAATVTINGTSTLGLDRSGVDMSTATRSLVVNTPVELRETAPWNISSSTSATFSDTLLGYGGITLGGSGTLILSGANTFTGPIAINGGTLRLGNGGTTGSLNPNSIITVGSGATFQTNRSDDIEQGTDFSGAAISGAGGLRKTGAGKLTLTAANMYTGPTTLSVGTLAFNVAAPFANTSGISMADTTLLQPLIGGASISKPITLGGVGTTAAISAPTNLPGAGVVSTFTLGGVISGSGNVTFTSSAAQNALSTVLLNAQNTYTGNTRLDTAGSNTNTQVVLRLGIANALPISTVLTIDGQVGAGTGRYADVNLNGFSQELAGLTNVARNLRVQRIVNSNVSSPATLTINNSGDYTYSGTLGGGANGSVSASAMPGSTNGNNLALTKKGTGKFTLTGNNSYTGGTTITAGTLQVGTGGNVGTGTVTNNATFDIARAGLTTAAITGTGTTTVTAASATLTANSIRQAGLTIGAGNTVTIAPNGGNSGMSRVTNLSINATGKLDLKDNDLIVDNGNLASLTALVSAGFNGGIGNGPGINSTAAVMNPNGTTTLGIAANSELGYASFSGLAVDANDVLIKYTYFGDADLNGVVDSSTDFDLYITGLTSGGSLGGWLYGDFEYNGIVDSSTDFDLYITGLTGQSGSLLTAGSLSVTTVPEPGSLVLLAAGVCGAGVLLRRRPLSGRR